jgi:predicted RNase H-like HicB family nuclease
VETVAHKEIEKDTETGSVELRVTNEEARRIASLLRYVVSLNTTVGLISSTQRRLATPTYRAVELAALILEGKSFEEAAREAEDAWSGCLEEDHHRALELIRSTRDTLQSAMTGPMAPEQFAEYLEISQQQFLELVKSGMLTPAKIPGK